MNIKRENYFTDKQICILLLIFGLITFVSTLNSSYLIKGDESRVSGISTQIAIYNNWLKPELNGKEFLEKPPLFFWTDALSLKVFGFNSFGARFPSAIFATLAILSVFLSLRNLGMAKNSALLSSIILASSAQFFYYAHKAMIDMMLAVFIAFSFLTFLQYCNTKTKRKKYLYFILFTLSLSGAIFSKGLVGLAIPGSAIFTYLFLSILVLKKRIKINEWITLFAGSALAFIPVGIWVLLLYNTYGYDAFYTVVWTNNIGRFTGSHAEHVEPFYYYLKKLPEQFQPWTIFLLFAIYFHILEVKKYKSSISLFFLCWLLIPYLLLCFSAGKRQVYILPLYTSAACLTGLFLISAYNNWRQYGLKGLKYLFIWNDDVEWNKNEINNKDYFAIFTQYMSILFMIAGIGFIIFSIIVKDYSLYIIITLLLIVLSLITNILFKKKNYKEGYFCFIITFALLFASIHCNIFRFITHKKSYAYLFEECKKLEKEGEKIVLLQLNEGLRGGAVFYMGKKVKELQVKNINNADLHSTILVFKGGKEKTLPKYLKNFKILKSYRVKNRYIFLLTLKEQ
jgi:hypothetical protein